MVSILKICQIKLYSKRLKIENRPFQIDPHIWCLFYQNIHYIQLKVQLLKKNSKEAIYMMESIKLDIERKNIKLVAE